MGDVANPVAQTLVALSCGGPLLHHCPIVHRQVTALSYSFARIHAIIHMHVRASNQSAQKRMPALMLGLYWSSPK